MSQQVWKKFQTFWELDSFLELIPFFYFLHSWILIHFWILILIWILILFWILFHFLILIHLRNVTHLCNSIHLCNLINLLIHNFRFTLIQTCWDTLYYRGENRNTKCTFCNFALLYSMYCSAITYSSSTQCNVHL